MTSKVQLILAAAVLATLVVSTTSDTIDSYMLSLQWPPSYCSVNNCKKPINNLWVIHGLWPQDAKGNGIPAYSDTNKCVSVDPYKTAVELVIYDIKSKLNTNWPSLLANSDNNKFWQHEWDAHGKCSDYPQDPKAYFNAGLSLRSSYDPLTVIGVTAGGRATLATILANIQKKNKKNPQVFCLTDKAGRVVLVEVRFCFARASKAGKPPSSLVDCATTSSNCPTTGDIVVPTATLSDSNELDIIREVVSI